MILKLSRFQAWMKFLPHKWKRVG